MACFLRCGSFGRHGEIFAEQNKKLIQQNASAQLGKTDTGVVKPLVDAFFAYLKQNEPKIPKNGKIREAFTYALNQESYLKVFLEDGDVPIDNNASERAIRGFCIGKKNWEMIDTVNGANSSAIIYSIAETAKARL